MNKPLALISFFLSLIFTVIAIFLSAIFYKGNQKSSFKFQNMLPFELMEGLNQIQRDYLKIPLLLAALSIFTFFYSSFFVTSLPLTYFILIIILLILLTGLLLFYLKTRIIKSHLVVMNLFLIGQFMLSVLITYYSFVTPYVSSYHQLLKYGGIVLAAMQLLILFNPSLKHWDRLQKVKKDDGSEIYERPRFLVLAYSQWLTFINLFLLETIVLISLFI